MKKSLGVAFLVNKNREDLSAEQFAEIMVKVSLDLAPVLGAVQFALAVTKETKLETTIIRYGNAVEIVFENISEEDLNPAIAAVGGACKKWEIDYPVCFKIDGDIASPDVIKSIFEAPCSCGKCGEAEEGTPTIH